MIEGAESLPDDTLTFVTVGLFVEVGVLLRRVDRVAHPADRRVRQRAGGGHLGSRP